MADSRYPSFNDKEFDLLKKIAYNSALISDNLSISSLLDMISSTRGSVLYRGASGWAALTPGTAGQFLQTGGAGANPSWGTGTGVLPSQTGNSGKLLTTDGTNASWGLAITGNFAITGDGNNLLLKRATATTSNNYIQFQQSSGTLQGYLGYTSSGGSAEELNIYNGANQPVKVYTNGALASTFGTDKSLTVAGNLTVSGTVTQLGTANGSNYFITPGSSTSTGVLAMQAGQGSSNFGGGLAMFSNAHASRPGYVIAGLSAVSGAKFVVNSSGWLGDGADVFTVDRNGAVTAAGTATFSGTGTSSMAGSLNLAPVTAPASPASGWTFYVDSGDSNKLKAKASTGTVVTLGTP